MTPVAEVARDEPQIIPVRVGALPGALSRVAAPAPARSIGTGTIIARQRLLEQLDQAGRVSVISAPAGSGKTSLLRSWVGGGRVDSAAWLTLAGAERHPHSFWSAVLEALSHTDGGSTLIREVTTAASMDGWAFVDRLLGDLALLEDRVWLVIDDLDELDGTVTLRQFERLLAAAPQQLRLMFSTRRDLNLGLHRIRVAGELTELRAADLRFTIAEARALLAAADLELSESALALLVERTEGWAAGLRLAALSLREHPAPDRFVAEFSGRERTVAEYLLAEVLEGLPAEVRELLLRTSVLERVSGPLADRLTGGAGSERILQDLEDANAFVTSLDAPREWFRYHRLFAELLQLELQKAAPAVAGSLHRTAAEWHEEDGDVVEAIRHAQAARDWSLASRVLADNALDLTLAGRSGTIRELLRGFPDVAAETDAELALVIALARLLEGEHEDCGAYLDLAQELVPTVAADRRQRFDLILSEVRLALARWRGDLTGVMEALPSVEAAQAAQPVGQRALSDALRSAALLNVGIAELWSSRLDAARRDLQQALTLARQAGRPWLEIPCLGHLALASHSLSEGLELSDEAIAIAEAHGWSDDPALVTALAAGATALLWQGRFDDAEARLGHAAGALTPDGEPGTELIVHHARALLQLARGQFDAALSALLEAEQMQGLLADDHPFAAAAGARLVQVHVQMGQLSSARSALAAIGDEGRDLAEVRVALARLQLAEGEAEPAVDALAPVIDGRSRAWHEAPSTAEACVLDAVARAQLADERAAAASLERALELAEPEGMILPFLLAPVRDLLESVPRHRTAHATLIQTILDVLDGSSPPATGDIAAPLLDALSEAELRVVRYLPSNLRAPEIAAELCVSTNTVRTHIRHIYSKLDAHGRAEAVARARELGLLAPRRSLR